MASLKLAIRARSYLETQFGRLYGFVHVIVGKFPGITIISFSSHKYVLIFHALSLIFLRKTEVSSFFLIHIVDMNNAILQSLGAGRGRVSYSSHEKSLNFNTNITYVC